MKTRTNYERCYFPFAICFSIKNRFLDIYFLWWAIEFGDTWK